MPDPGLPLAPSQALLTPPTAARPAVAAPATTHAVLDSALLLQGQQEVTIYHLGQHYRLRVTALGKLILTK